MKSWSNKSWGLSDAKALHSVFFNAETAFVNSRKLALVCMLQCYSNVTLNTTLQRILWSPERVTTDATADRATSDPIRFCLYNMVWHWHAAMFVLLMLMLLMSRSHQQFSWRLPSVSPSMWWVCVVSMCMSVFDVWQIIILYVIDR